MAELPFVLMHPKPDDIDENNILINECSSPSNNNNNGVRSSRNSVCDKQNAVNNTTNAKDDAPNLIQLDG